MEQRRQNQSCSSDCNACCEGATLFISTGCVRITVATLGCPVILYACVCSWLGVLQRDSPVVVTGMGLEVDKLTGRAVAVVPCPSITGDSSGLPTSLEFCIETICTDTLGRLDGGLMRFSFCRRLQNHTRTTSLSICKLSANIVTSSDVGFEFTRKLFSSATRIDVSMLVRFFRRLLAPSGDTWDELSTLGLAVTQSASSSHFWSSGFSLHMFLKLRLSASKREIVVWLKSLPYNLPMARPTSPCVKPEIRKHRSVTYAPTQLSMYNSWLEQSKWIYKQTMVSWSILKTHIVS